MAIREQLQQRLQQLAFDLSEQKVDQLITYLHLLQRWNQVYSLTSLTDPHEMVMYHLLDSLVIQSYLYDDQIADIGTGAGIPGLPLAIANPDKQFLLIECQHKKISFLRQVVYELALVNVEIVPARVEHYHPEQRCDTILSRAFSSLPKMLQLTQHLGHTETRFLVMKGKLNEDEITAIPSNFRMAAVQPLDVPGLQAQRHLLIIEENHCG